MYVNFVEILKQKEKNAPGKIRTPDLQLRRLSLYLLEEYSSPS